MEILATLDLPEHNAKLTLYDNYTTKGTGILQRKYYSYNFVVNDTTLFYGNDFSPSPMANNDSLDSLTSLLSFLTLKPGDTDDEYFASYNQKQLDFVNSQLCEDLQTIPYDFENGELYTYFVVSQDNKLPYENYTIVYK